MNANKILEDAETTHDRVSPYIRESADVFHDNEGELFTRAEATQLLTNEVNISADVARDVLTQLVGDTVDPIVQVVRGSEKYIGVIEFHEFDGAYGYINYDDRFGEGKRVVCQQCVNEAELDSEVTHATANDPMGSFADGASWEELLVGIHQHYEQAHDTIPEDVETGATLASGTTIGGNIAFHQGSSLQEISNGRYYTKSESRSWTNNNADVPNADHADTVGTVNANGHTLYLQDNEPNNPNYGDIWIDTS